jgi:hypothetical protein
MLAADSRGKLSGSKLDQGFETDVFKGGCPVPNTRFRVKVAFSAMMVATRRREAFAPGEMIVLVEGSESAAESRFIRLNGLRPSRGVECRYTIGCDELKEKTELAGHPK